MGFLQDSIDLVHEFANFFGYESKNDKQIRLAGEEQSRRHQEATRMMIDLHGRYHTMTVSSILDELEHIHQFSEVDSWARGNSWGYFYDIAKHLDLSDLAREDVDRIAVMLQWNDLRGYQDRSAPFHFLWIVNRFPDAKYIPILNEHLAWLEREEPRELESRGLTHYHADVAGEIKFAKKVIANCTLPR